MNKDTLKLNMLAWQLEQAGKLLDAQKVPQRGRMVWDGWQMHESPEMDAAIEKAVQDLVVYGNGQWMQEQSKATHIDARTIYKPVSPAEIDAYMQRLVEDDIETHFNGTWRVRPLVAALRRIYP